MAKGVYKRSQEVIDRLRSLAFSQKGKPLSKETREKMSRMGKEKGYGKWMLGRKLTEETKRKIGRASLGHPVSLEMRRKIGAAHKGEKSAGWKGGIYPAHKKIRESIEYKLWRKAVFERDGYACIWGGKAHGSKINADHIKPFALFPELRFAIDNGRTLCEDCHRKTDTYGTRKPK